MAARAAPTLDLPGVPLAEDPEFSRQLYLGAPGSGKTTALAHMAHQGNIVILKAEAGLKVRRLQKLGVPTDRIRVLPATSYDDMDTAFWLIKGALEDDPNSIAGVGWDSVSEMSLRFHAIARGLDWEEYQRKLAQTQEDPEHSRWFTDRSVWGEVAGQLGELITKYNDLPCHFVVTALPRRDEDENEGTVTYNPAVQPALLTPLTGKMDLIGRFEAVGTTPQGDEVIKGTFRGGGSWNVKDRDGALPPVLWYPTFDRVLDYVEERLTADTDPVQLQYAEAEAAQALAPPTSGPRTPVRRRRATPDDDTKAATAAESE